MAQGSHIKCTQVQWFFSFSLPTLPTQPGFQNLRLGCFLPSWQSTFSWTMPLQHQFLADCRELVSIKNSAAVKFPAHCSQVYFQGASALTNVQQAFPESHQENDVAQFTSLPPSSSQGKKQRKAMYQMHHTGTYKWNHNFDTSRKTATTYPWGCIMDL